jgi:ribonuclease R
LLYLDGGKSVEETYETKCLHSSTMEGLATNAERDSIKYMQKNTCKIIRIKSFGLKGYRMGIYVEIIENKCEGMVRIEIYDDYTFDENNMH